MSTGPVFTAGGLASGIDTNSLISQLIAIEQRPITLMQEQIQTLNFSKAQVQNISGRASTLQNTVSSLLAKSVLDENLFNAKQATGSNDDIVAATVTEDASPQTIQLEVLQLATSTSAVGQSGLGQLITGTDTLASVEAGALTDGDFTLYVDGTEHTITVDTATQTLDDVLTQISGIGGGITGASVTNGQIQIDFTAGTDIHVGSQSDTSNFATIAQLNTAVPGATSLLGTRPLTTLDNTVAMNDVASGLTTTVTDGTFSINGVEFDTTGKTLSEMLAEINSSTEAGVTASINRLTNRLELRSDETGSNFINFTEGTSNFLSATGLVVGGNTITSQTAGQNASFMFNGSQLFSTSNTVSSDITSAAGVTLDLKQAEVGTTVEISVSTDTSRLKDTLDTFVRNINDLFELIDSQTDAENGGVLAGETGLTRFKSDVRTILSNGVDGLNTYNSLAAIGVSTGAVGAALSSTYSVDSATLDAALADNPSQVEQLLIGTGNILEQLDTLLEQATTDDVDDSLDGLFQSKVNSIDNRVDILNDRISDTQLRLEQRETLLRRQFQQMEAAYSQANQQSASLSGLVAQLGANG